MANEKRFFLEEEIMDELYDRTVHGSPVGMQFANAFAEFLKELTPIDAVEVVRCKDCKHRGDATNCPMCFEETSEWDDDGYLEVDFITHDQTVDDGFCDRGERSTDYDE